MIGREYPRTKEYIVKRLSLLVALASIIGVMGIASSSASADVLCDTWGYASTGNTYCPAGHKYEVGTKLNAYLPAGRKVTLSYDKAGLEPELVCTQSTMEMSLAKVGNYNENARATISSIAFNSCKQAVAVGSSTNATVTTNSTGEAVFDEYSQGSWNARATFLNNQFQFYSPFFGATCKFKLPTTAEIHGPSWTGTEVSQLVFNSAAAQGCWGSTMYLKGTYDFALPGAIYAAQY
jgi:hypothetical protein